MNQGIVEVTLIVLALENIVSTHLNACLRCMHGIYDYVLGVVMH